MTEDTYGIKVLNIKETLDYIIEHQSSVARFGDGELDLIMGRNIPYQKYDKRLAQRLKTILYTPSSAKFVVCLSDVFHNLDRYTDYAQQFWKNKLPEYSEILEKLGKKSNWFGSTFISRPYIDMKDKSNSANSFNLLKQLWDDRDVLIVEGKLSRSGVGNDLFDNARSIKRIIAPAKDAYDRYDELLWLTKYHAENRLILLMLGPTAKVMAYDLANDGYQALDIGHIDSEYEWFKMGATSKVDLPNKHTAEHNFDENVTLIPDKKYDSQIVIDVSQLPKKEPSTATVMAADASYLMPLSTALKSIFANGYTGIVYVMNSDIPQEWFMIVNAKLKQGQIKDLKIDSEMLRQAPENENAGIDNHINYMAYARLFAPNMIDVDRLLRVVLVKSF